MHLKANIIAIAVLFIVECPTAFSASSFTCEKIKDKATRSACVQDRIEKTKALEAEKVKASEADQARAAEASRRAELDAFVNKSKQALTANYKDPQSAQYKDLVISDGSPMGRALCGSVNGKNSYGAYVGFHRFRVEWLTGTPSVWNEGETTRNRKSSDSAGLRENTAKIIKIEDELNDMTCAEGDRKTLTKLEG